MINWKSSKYYFEGILALIFFIRWGNNRPGTPQDRVRSCFKESEVFLNEFEDRNKDKLNEP